MPAVAASGLATGTRSVSRLFEDGLWSCDGDVLSTPQDDSCECYFKHEKMAIVQHAVITTVSIDRATCCLQQSINQPEDIYGRSNCTLPCTEPRNLIPKLVNDDPTRSQHSSQDNKENAFFIETTACAVESLAMHNPNLKIHVLFTDVTINQILVTLQKLVENYANVQFVSLNMDDYMAGKLMDHWYHCTDWRNGSYHVNNLSNALRLLTVYKYGGYHFDLDIISDVPPLTIYRNFVAAESDKHVYNGVIHADFKNSLIETTIIKDFVVNFRPDVLNNNGPALIFRASCVLQKWCNADNLKTMEYINCRGFNVLPESSFHPVHFNKMKEFAHKVTDRRNR
uniref:Alpha 1,4-glycosyltransferase domain-containing protein n=1 Tax=Daphnia galeata TaxID=27404 RepID=A0A8J2RZA1_9CRUS|nr:unnamed protein product [Daphnia galeata]